MLLSINPTLHIQAKYVQTFLFLPRHSPQQHHCSLRSLTDLNFFQQQPPRKIDKALQKSEAELSCQWALQPTLSWGCFFFDQDSHSLMIFPQRVQRSSSAFSWKLMLPEVMEICEVSDDLRECPLWQDSELSDLASVSINLQEVEAVRWMRPFGGRLFQIFWPWNTGMQTGGMKLIYGFIRLKVLRKCGSREAAGWKMTETTGLKTSHARNRRVMCLRPFKIAYFGLNWL